MRCLFAAILLCVAQSGTTVADDQAAITAQNLTDDHVQKAIAAMVEELYARKDVEQFWDPVTIPTGESARQKGGYTALVVLALLSAGQSYQDPRLRDAVDYLETFGMEGTYAISLRASVWARLPPKFKPRLASDTAWLIDGFSPKVGGWDYVQDPHTTRKDNSIRQFGALALWEAAKRGLPIEKKYWQGLEQAYVDTQMADGGWNYKGDGPATGSMTAAGLATLYITQDFLHSEEFIRLNQRSQPRHQLAIDNGLKWMNANFNPEDNPGSFRDYYYYIFGIERVGLASGRKYFGAHDWYREGAAELIRRLCKWDPDAETMTVHETVGGAANGGQVREMYLAFALMFLSRGRVPVAINKLEFDGAWNNRPRDVAHLVARITQNSESSLNWQIVDLASEPSEWLDAPMLYMASHETPKWLDREGIDVKAYVRQVRDFLRRRARGEVTMDTPPPPRPDVPELNRLKTYLDLGGMLFAVNEGGSGSKSFASAILDAGSLMYPQYDWRDLPADHWAYTIHKAADAQGGAATVPLRGLSNGVRELIIIAPSTDFSEVFQSSEGRHAALFDIATNIYLYASEMNRARPRLARHVQEDGDVPDDHAGAEHTITIVQAIHEGNWKPEPHALDAFAAAMRRERNLSIRIIDHPLVGIGTLQPRPNLVLISGTDPLEFSEAQKQAIKEFAAAGGILLFETPGGNMGGRFTVAAEQMAGTLFGVQVLPLTRSSIVTGQGLGPGAVDCSRVEYRPFALQAFDSREIAPRLRGLSLKDGSPPQILFSREDLTFGLLDQPRWGVVGYAPKAARDLLGNIAQFAAGRAGASESMPKQ